jgi:hypothetical protein
MHYRILKQAVVVLGLALLVAGCDKSSPTNPNGGGNFGGNGATVTSLAITGTFQVAEGETSQLKATATLSNGSDQDVSSQATWQSSDTSVATISGTGLLTALKAGTTDITATYSGRTARVTVTVTTASYRLRVVSQSVTVLGTCDDFTQGLGHGEFTVRVRATLANGSYYTLYETSSYPGSPSNPHSLSIAKGASRSISGSRDLTLSGASGQYVRVEFRATEWDTQIVVFPPSTRNVHDGSMDDRSISRTHSYGNGSFGFLGPQTLTIGNSSCGIRLNYTITAERR